jgi:hypothetical protein
MTRAFSIEPLDGDIQIEQQRALTVVADHALNPEEGRETSAACDGPYMMQTCGRVQDQVSRRELDVVRSVGILDNEFAAFVLVRRSEEQRGRKVGSNSVGGSRN